MAYVAMTSTLIGEVRNGFYNKRMAEIQALGLDKALEDIASNEELRSMIDEYLWSDLADLRPRLEKYSSKEYVVDVTTPLPGTNAKREFRFRGLSVPCFWRPSSTYSELIEFELDMSANPAIRRHHELTEARVEAETRWTTVEKQVVEFLRKAKSLNEAVKLWPDVRQFIPASYLGRLDEKSEKAKAKADKEAAALEALKKVDLDLVAASNVLLRMTAKGDNNPDVSGG